MKPENRNLVLAVVLSMAVLFGWQIFVVQPELEKEQARMALDTKTESLTTQQNGAPVAPQSSNDVMGSRRLAGVKAPGPELAFTETEKRILIDAPLVRGSFSIKGSRIDDIVLTGYQENLNPDSENIHFLKKVSSSSPFFAEFGWSTADTNQPMPNGETVWQSDSNILTPKKPVTLRWDNQNGLVFIRTISINEDYLITYDDTVVSRQSEPVTLFPYGLVRRHGRPDTFELYILHEGPLGVFDETLNEQDYDDLTDAASEGIKITPENAGGWIGITDKYWLAALLPSQDENYQFSFQSLGGSGNRFQVDYINESGLVLSGGGTISTKGRLFAGAKKVVLLDQYSEELGIPNFDLAIDFGWFYFLTKPFFYALNWLYNLFGNFGIATLAFTVVVKLAFFPANKSYHSMAKMRVLAPKLQLLGKIWRSRMRLNQEMMALYKTEKVNPAAGAAHSSSNPVFFALYKVLFDN